MIAALLLSFAQEAPLRTPAIYRIPASVIRLDKLEEMVAEDYFDGYCIEPSATPAIKAILAQGKVPLVSPKTIDTKANVAWRNATVAYAKGEISPKEWLRRTKNLKETIHFLTSPKTRELRKELPISYHASFAEVFTLAWPGKLCFTSTDTWQARWWPENDKRFDSWILAMNDHLGPMMYARAKSPYLAKQTPKVISAPDKPGLFIFEQKAPKGSLTFYFNNSNKPVRLPKIDLDHATHNRGLNVEEGYSELAQKGSLIIDTTPDEG